MYIGIASVYLFHSVIIFFISDNHKIKKENIFKNDNIHITKDFKKSNIILILLIFLISFLLVGYLFFNNILNISRSIYEYLLILFIIAFYYCRNKKLYTCVLFILMMISTFFNMKSGGRIVSLQPIIAFYFITFYEKINSKKIFWILISGIIIFTVFGIYGDFLVAGTSMSELTLKRIIDTFLSRKFALDTSISSYWTGITFIEIANKFTNLFRLKNGIQYFTLYTLFGTRSSYVQIFDISRQYYLHYGGGFLTSYFYFWGGFIGVFIIGLIIAILINKFESIKQDSNDFLKMFYIYFLSCLPRWYLYYPTSLFRGTLILYIIYTAIKLFIKEDKKQNEVAK